MTFDEFLLAIGPLCNFVDRRFDLVLQRASLHGQITAVSYDNAVAREGTALPATLRAMGLPETLVDESTSFTTRHNARSNWQFTEVVRLLNGVIADRRGLPGDELFPTLVESRPDCTLFDYARPISQLPQVLVKQLTNIVDTQGRDRILTMIEGTQEVEAALNERYPALFSNLIDGLVFPTNTCMRITTCDLDAKDFYRRHAAIVDPALTALEHLWKPSSEGVQPVT